MRKARHRLGRDGPRKLLAPAAWRAAQASRRVYVLRNDREQLPQLSARTAAATECILP